MARQIIWLPKAEERFDEIIFNLQKNWTEKEVSNFIKRTETVLNLISAFPRLYRRSKKKNIYEALITKHNLLLYRITRNNIELITFFDTRQDPKKRFKN